MPKVNQVEPFYAMDVLAAAAKAKAEGRPVISMATGQPAHKAPKRAIEAVQQAISERTMGYTDALGLFSLRNAISEHYHDQYGIEVDPSRIMVTNGSSAAFNLTFLTLFQKGQSIAISRPGYPAYRNIIKALGLNCIEVELSADTNFTLTPEALEAAEHENGVRIDGVLLASPANPTGTVTSKQDLTRLAAWCEARDRVFISDEIYHGLVFSGKEETALSISHNNLIINSFSKYYCMTGWRVGWMVLPQNLVRAFECMGQNLYISPPEMSQIAAEVALKEREELDDVYKEYACNRKLLLQALPKIGLELASPMDGAFYAYVDVSPFSNDSSEFAAKMLEEIDVAAVPGRDFDPIGGHKYLRFSYAGSHEDMLKAVSRLKTWLAA